MHACTNIGMFSSGGRRRLFMNGNEFESTTGGWMSQSWTGNSAVWTGSSPGKAIVGSVLRSAGMSAIGQSGKSGVVRTTNKVDLTNVSEIQVTLNYTLGATSDSNGGYQRVYMFTSQVTSGEWTSLSVATALSLKFEQSSSSSFTAKNRVYTLNVSSLSGEHYVCMGYVWRYQNTPTTIDIVSVELIP